MNDVIVNSITQPVLGALCSATFIIQKGCIQGFSFVFSNVCFLGLVIFEVHKNKAGFYMSIISIENQQIGKIANLEIATLF